MPRKKQGLRSYHHKSRNGCMQCKRRRVKCSMQAPTCANCTRRNEVCEYPTFLEQSPPLENHAQTRTVPAESCDHSEPFPYDASAKTWDPGMATFDSVCQAGKILGDAHFLLSVLFSQSCLSAEEQNIWIPALSRLIIEYSYLQHSVLALTYLRRGPSAYDAASTPAAAFQHQLTASSLFRQSASTVDKSNWLAVLAFGTCNLFFQFFSQNCCIEPQFDLVGTLRVVRSTTDLHRAAEPFFRQSQLWSLIVTRSSRRNLQSDIGMKGALQNLGIVVSDSAANEFNDDDEEATAEINRQAFEALREWIFQCQGAPLGWDEYCRWPSQVTAEYLDLLADANDVALLIFIHWAAIMYCSRKTVVKSWAKRAAFYAVDHLKDDWGEQLTWALDILSLPTGLCTYQPMLFDEALCIDLALSPSPTPSLSTMAEDCVIDPALYAPANFV